MAWIEGTETDVGTGGVETGWLEARKARLESDEMQGDIG